ncbi:hypothetical protein, partial [Paenibacillus polymyxa]|uniref:hypothetical protein n=1 Tax=Paenibacillus polymyxa TaxID=1406 RepID=UPI001E3A72AF
TRPLSPPAPMVLGPQGPGRVGRRQAQKKSTALMAVFFLYIRFFCISDSFIIHMKGSWHALS